MTEEVFSVAASAPLDDVAWALVAHGLAGAPVEDDEGRLVGTVSKAALADPERGVWSRGGLLGRTRAADVMSPRLVIVHADAPAREAVRLLAREHVDQVLVVDERDRVVGMVTPMDVLRALARGDRLDDDDQARPPSGDCPIEPRH